MMMMMMMMSMMMMKVMIMNDDDDDDDDDGDDGNGEGNGRTLIVMRKGRNRMKGELACLDIVSPLQGSATSTGSENKINNHIGVYLPGEFSPPCFQSTNKSPHNDRLWAAVSCKVKDTAV